MAFAALALATGIGLDWALRPSLAPECLLLAAAGAGVWLLRGRSGAANLCLLLLLAGAGALRAGVDRREPPPAAAGPVTLEGFLSGEPALSPDGRSWVGWFRAEDGARYQARLPSAAGEFLGGESLRLSGFLRPGRPPARGSGFDERRWLWVHGARGRLAVSDPEGIVRLRGSPDVRLRYLRWVVRLKRALAGQAELLLPRPESGLLKALLLGERRGLPAPMWEAFRRTGTVHVLVVSGLHVGLIGGIGLLCLTALGTPPAARYLLLAGVLATYGLLTGLQPPIARATLTGLLFCWGRGRGLPLSPANLLGSAATGMLALWPRTLADVSFQLSFAAVAGILLAVAILRRWERARSAGAGDSPAAWRGLRQAAAASCGAWAATIPLTAWHFHSFSWIAPLANLIVVPWAALLVAVGFLLCGAGLLVHEAAVPFAALFCVLARGLAAAVQWAAGWPGFFWTL